MTRELGPGLRVMSRPRMSKSTGTVEDGPRLVQAAGRVMVHCGKLKRARRGEVCHGGF